MIVNARKPPEQSKASNQEEGWVLEYGLTFEDLAQIEQTLPMVAQVLPVHDVERWVWFKSRRVQAKVRGIVPAPIGRNPSHTIAALAERIAAHL